MLRKIYDLSTLMDIPLLYKCLKKGINGVGIPDLIIAQNAIQNHCEIYSLDNHFKMIQQAINLKLID